MHKPFGLTAFILIVWMVALACNMAAPQPTVSFPTPTDSLVEVVPTEALLVEPSLLFIPATFQDVGAEFAFDYPADWTADNAPQAGEDRDYYAQLTSWARQPNSTFDELPPDSTVLTVEVLLWDPRNDPDAYINQRKLAWDASEG